MKAEDLPSGLSRTIVVPEHGARGRPSGASGESGSGTSVTAEIPAIPVGPDYGVLLPNGSIWYPGSRKRLPAPLLLRIVVWALAFLVLIAAAGDFIIHSHPSWVDPLRHVVPASSATSGSSSSSSSSRAATGSSGGAGSAAAPSVSAANPQPAGLPTYTTAYLITGVSNYAAVVKATQATWVIAYKLVNGADQGSPLFSGTMQSGQSQTIPASGPIDLEVAAAGASVSVTSGNRQIGTIANPPSVPWHFYLQPAGR